MPYTIYMSELNIPTRKFSEGFQATDGKLIMNSEGTPLFENFGIEFTSNLVLRPEDAEGYYQLSLIADDGVVLELKPIDEAYEVIIKTDHITPSKFSCAKDSVRMVRGKQVPITLKYFQGPRYHVSLILLWRKVADLEGHSDGLIKIKTPKEIRCGIAGNKYFFDPDDRSHPTMNYLDLLDPSKRQVPWSVVKHKNFKLPGGYTNDECKDP